MCRESVLNKIVTSGILDIWEILEDSSENSACYPWQTSRNVHDFNVFLVASLASMNFFSDFARALYISGDVSRFDHCFFKNPVLN